MKLFGEFLLQKGMVDKAGLADALVEQVSRMPTYTELAWKANALTPDSLLALLKIQAESKSGFVEAARQMGLWSAQLEAVLVDGARTHRVPIGEILVNRGLLSPESLAHALDEFLSEVPDTKAAATNPPAVAKPVSEPAPASASAQAQAPAPAASGLGKERVYGEAFGNELKDRLLRLSKAASTASTGESVRELFDCVHQVKGAARMADQKAAEELCGKLEDTLKLLIPLKALGPELATNLSQAAEAATGVLLELRQEVLQGKNEEAYLAGSAGAEAMKKAIGLVDLLKFDAEMAGGKT